jgi:hypothetical protein
VKRALRFLLVGVVAGGAIGYGAIANQAKAASTMTLQLQLTIRCQRTLGNSNFMMYRTCIDTGATLDGSFVGDSGVTDFGPTQGGPCYEPWTLSGGPDRLSGIITCNGPGTIPQVSVTGGSGRFAGYTAPPTPEPTFVYGDVDVPYVGVTIPATPVREQTTLPVCGSGGPGFEPPVNCPETGDGTGLVILTLTGP